VPRPHPQNEEADNSGGVSSSEESATRQQQQQQHGEQREAATSAGQSAAATEPLSARVLQLARLELRGCTDVPRMLEGALVIAALAGEPACSYAALQSALALLVSRYPRVRRYIAEQLYLSLLGAEDVDDEDDEDEEGMGEEGSPSAAGTKAVGASGSPAQPVGWRLPGCDDGLEAAQDLLLSSPWDGPLDAARAARGQLAQLLRVEVRARVAGAGGAAADAGAKRAAAGAAAAGMAAKEDFLSYQSLLDDAARGGGY